MTVTARVSVPQKGSIGKHLTSHVREIGDATLDLQLYPGCVLWCHPIDV